ncbi:MAG: cytochrome c oxidase subunit II [Acidobacteria bacterium]|jgi:cytochrome c oxidase subunit 2|nr:MAG: cytochrome c oxidase subunit II [Acidobacteriota bacterium]
MRKILVLLALSSGAMAEDIFAYPRAYWENSVTVWFWVAVAIYLIVAIPSVYFMVKYHYKPGKNEEGEHIEGNTALEIVWTVIPTIIVLFLGTYSFANFVKQRQAPEGALELKVTAFMWGWEIEYPNGKKVYTFFNQVADPEKNIYLMPEKIDDSVKAYIPAGKPVKVYCTSRDVIHSFFVHEARVTEDCVPGRITKLWFQFNKPGEYWVFCREYCGTWHSRMATVLKAVSEEEFNKWLGPTQGAQQPAPAEQAPQQATQ